MKRKRLIGKQSVGAPCPSVGDVLPEALQKMRPEVLGFLDFRACCRLQAAAGFWRGSTWNRPPQHLESLWRRVSNITRPFLEDQDWCHLEAASPYWLQNAAGEASWQTLLVERFGAIPAIPGLEALANLPTRRMARKFLYFLHVSWRIVPGERAAGIRIGLQKSKLLTKPCDTIVPRYYIPEYLSPGKGYFFLDFKPIGGPVEWWERLADERARQSFDLPVAHEEVTPPLGVFDGYNTDFTGQCLTIWTDGAVVRAVGCHQASPKFGFVEIPGRPALKGISIGIKCQQLLDKLDAVIDDIIFGDSNPGGPTIFFEQLPRVSFEIDAENGGLAEVDDFTSYQDIDWLRPRLHFPISAIFVW